MNFVEELRWRGMLHDIMPGTEELLNKGMVSGYIGFDPTADSLHVGSLAQIMTMIHFQRAGHKPFALVGGATGMVGDPSGKSAERNLLSEDVLQHNLDGIKGQLEKFLDFNSGANSAQMVNNYDWFKDFSFLNFIRDVGKHITVNYMMAKDSVKNRINGDTGMSFTEFTYQLVQGYDFYYLWKNHNCALQMGGSDQWGNIVTGTELIRRKDAGEAYAITTKLIKKSDGTKFGKSEGGNIWLDPKKTSPYKFYQFWFNTSDEDAKTYIKIFTLLDRETIQDIEIEQDSAPHLRILQKALAKDITIRVHGEAEFQKIMQRIDFFHGKLPVNTLYNLNDAEITGLFEAYPSYTVKKSEFEQGINAVNLLSGSTTVFVSKGEAKRMIKGGGVSINKNKIFSDESIITENELINGKFLMAQKGKDNYYLIVAEALNWLENLTNTVQFWLKPIGYSGHPVPYGHKFDKFSEDLHFSLRPTGIRFDDILIGYGVGSKAVLSIFKAISHPKNSLAEDIEQEEWFQRWPWYIEGENLTTKYGSKWFKQDLILQDLTQEFLNKNPLENVTINGQSLGGLNFGKDKLRLNPKFAKFIIRHVLDNE